MTHRCPPCRRRCPRVVTAAALVLSGFLVEVSPSFAACGPTGVVLQVLGSGGPNGTGGRASASYLIWVDGTPRVMIDAGGGSFARFQESGADVERLDLLALSHLHPDHSSELPALMWTRAPQLTLAGPSGNAGFPAFDRFLAALFGATNSAFPVLQRLLDLPVVVVDVTATEPTEVYAADGIRVTAIGVPHGDVPAVGYRVDVGDASVGFSSDQVGTNPAFTRLVRETDLLVAHTAVPENVTGRGAELHARPSVWGQLATDAGVGTLVLSHVGSRVRDDLDASLAPLKATFTGPLVVADDLQCIPVAGA
jgi:ribonuclease BN (tRNA processing enzyme)